MQQYHLYDSYEQLIARTNISYFIKVLNLIGAILYNIVDLFIGIYFAHPPRYPFVSLVR